MALIGTVSGSNGTSNTAVSGTLVIADRPGASFPSIPGDAVLFVSGAIGGGSRAVIGGDVFVSGSFVSAAKFSAGLSGSLTQLTDGSSYLIASSSIEIVTASNGSVKISAKPAGSAYEVQFNDGANFTTNNKFFYQNDTLNIADLYLQTPDGGSSATIESDKFGLDIELFDNPVAGSSLEFTGGGSPIAGIQRSGLDRYMHLDSPTRLKIGTPTAWEMELYYDTDVSEGYLTNGTGPLNISSAAGIDVTGPTTFNQGLSGSLTHLTDGSSYLVAGSNVTITSASNGSVTIAASGGGGSSTVTETFKEVISFTATTASFVVPPGVTSIHAKLWGPGGGTGGYDTGGDGDGGGGSGGFASGSISVTPGETLYVIVGGGGGAATGSAGDAGFGGWAGGGDGAKGDASGGGGGGYTGIFTGSVEHINSILIAGGGGGGTGFTVGGGGGGTAGITGGTYGTAILPGVSGSQTEGGRGGSPGTVYSGSALLGGAAGGPSTDRTTSGNDDGGGGGAGYYGGGGGAQDASGGGGGSGYFNPGRVNGGYLETGNTGAKDGSRSNPPKTADADYTGIVGTGGGVVAAQGQDGGNGLVVFTYDRTLNVVNWLEDSANSAYITSSIVVGSAASAADYGSDVFVYISGSNSDKTVLGGGLHVSGTTKFEQGLSGSLTKLSDGSSYLVAGTNITVVSNSNGSVTVGSTAPVETFLPFGSEPGSPSNGDVNFTVGSPFIQKYDSVAAEWLQYERNYGIQLTPPNQADFGWYNQSTCTEETGFGGIRLTKPTGSAGITIRSGAIDDWGAPGIEALIELQYPLVGTDYTQGGLWVGRSGGGQYIIGLQFNQGFTRLLLERYNSSYTYNSPVGIFSRVVPTTRYWFKIEVNTNIIFYVSSDGNEYYQAYSEPTGSWIGDPGPNQIGYFASLGNGNQPARTWVLSWKGLPVG